MKKIHYISGLPRACSTLLCNILSQNPMVHSTGSSPVHEIGYTARQSLQTEEAKGMMPLDMESMYLNYVKGGIQSCFDGITDRPIVVDKNRSWVGHLDQLFKIFPEAKILIPVRDMRGVLTSMEKKFRQHPSYINSAEAKHAGNWTTLEKRIQGWLGNPPVGIAVERIFEANQRFGDKIMFVHAEELTKHPKRTMNKIWDYLGEDQFEHDFGNVEQYTIEHDVGFPYGDHIIRSKVQSLPEDWNEVLGVNISNSINEKFNWINNL